MYLQLSVYRTSSFILAMSSEGRPRPHSHPWSHEFLGFHQFLFFFNILRIHLLTYVIVCNYLLLSVTVSLGGAQCWWAAGSLK